MNFLRNVRNRIKQDFTLSIIYWLIIGPSICLFFVSIMVCFEYSESMNFLVCIASGWLLTILVFMLNNLIENENVLLIINLAVSTFIGLALVEYEFQYFSDDNNSGLDALVFVFSSYCALIPSYKVSCVLSSLIKQKRTELTNDTNSKKGYVKGVIASGITIAALVGALIAYEYPFNLYNNTLAKLAEQTGKINYQKYVDDNEWIFSIYSAKTEFECNHFTYSSYVGQDVVQENEVSYGGTCTEEFDHYKDQSKASLMCSVLSQLIDESEDIYRQSKYYNKFGSKLEEGKTISYRNEVTITGFETTYWFSLGSLDSEYYLKLDKNKIGTFVSKKYINEQEYYYNYKLAYENGRLKYFNLNNYSTPKESGYYDEKTDKMEVFSKSNSIDSDAGSNDTITYRTPRKTDSYNSSRYKDADSFADDYYEEFYDYGDYEDDDDAYDGAVDYWNDWND